MKAAKDTAPGGGHSILVLAPLALVCAFLFLTSTVELVPAWGTYDGKRIVQLWMIPAIFSCALFTPALRAETGALIADIPRPVAWALVAFFALGYASALAHPPWFYPLADVTLLVLLLMVTLVLAASRRLAGAAFDKLALGTVAALGAVVALQESMGVIAGIVNDLPYRYDLMLVRFAHPRFYNHLQDLAIPLLGVLPFVFRATRGVRALAVVLIALQWCLLLISGGRGATLALSVTLVLGLALGWRRARGWLAVQACGLALGTLLFAGFLAAQGTLFEASSSDVSPAGTEDKSAQVARQSIGHYTAPHSSGRNQLWSAALREARAQPWLGIGPARFACAPNRGAGAHPHSFAMQVLSEWGLPAAALLGLVAAWLALRVLLSLIRADRDDAHWLLRYSLGLSLAALGGHALLSGVPVVPAGQMALTLAIGWLLGLQGSGATAAPLLRGALLLAPTLLAGLWLAAAGTGAGLKMHPDDPAHGGSMPKPRLWQDGEICRYDQGSAKGQ